MRALRIAAILLLLSTIIIGCGPKSVAPVQHGDPSYAHKVFIATEDTEFKNAIVDRVIEAFREKEVHIQVTSPKFLEDVNPDDYTAIVLINTCIAWKVEPEIKSFLDSMENKDKAFLITTTGDPDLSIGVYGVDSVTSASTMTEVEPLAQDVIKRVSKIIQES